MFLCRVSIARRVAVVAAVSLLLALVGPPVSGSEHLEARKESVRQQIRQADASLEHSSAASRRTTRRLVAAREQLQAGRAALVEAKARVAAARARDLELAQELAVAEQRLVTAESALASGQKAAERQRQEVVDAIVATAQGVDPQLEALMSILNSDGVSDIVRFEEARSVMVSNETQKYDELKAAEVLLQVQQDEVAAARDDAAAKRGASAEALAELRVVRNDARDARAVVRRQVDAEWRASRRARLVQARDARALRRLRAEERRIEQRIAAAAQQARQRHGRSGTAATHSAFTRPTEGYISSPFGYRTHPIYGYYSLHDGVDIAAPCGTPVVAPLNGRVLSTSYSSVYGNRLFVGLGFVGGRYLTAVYNHLARSGVDRGDSVRRGQQLGTVGNTGWSTGCHLHFTLLAGGKPIDPERFF